MKKLLTFISLLFALPLLGAPNFFHAAGPELLQRMFLTELVPLLFPDNSFLARAKNDDAFVNYNTVELPNSGTIPNVAVNRQSFPALTTQRTDVATSYLLEELSTDPTLLQYSEELLVAYPKRSSILELHANAINDKAAIRALYKWIAGISGAASVTAGLLIKTTGAPRAAGAPGATGNRNAITKADFLNVKKLFDSQNIPQANRCAILSPAMYADLLGISDFTFAYAYGSPILPSGALGSIVGFNVYLRGLETGGVVTYSGTPVYDNNFNLKAEGATPASTDNQSAIFWHPDFVRRAKGAVKLYVNVDRADYYGSLFSAIVRFGALAARSDIKGVAVVTEQ